MQLNLKEIVRTEIAKLLVCHVSKGSCNPQCTFSNVLLFVRMKCFTHGEVVCHMSGELAALFSAKQVISLRVAQ